jgi:tetratricopeptide (TPR) repeat protein
MMKPMNQRVASQLKQAEHDFQAAFKAHGAGKLDEAKRLYLRVLRVTPADMETLYLLGTACSQEGDFAQAKRYLEKALALQPDHVETLNNLGLTLKGERRAKEAMVYYRRALALQPDYADALNNAGNALEYLGELDEAEIHLRRAIALAPEHADAWCNLGLVMNRKDRYEEAVQCLTRGLQLRPDHAISHDFLGSIYKIWGRFDEAMAHLDRALALSPDAYSTHNNRGAVLEEIGRYDEALEEYQRAAEILPGESGPRWNQAFLFLRQGMLERGWEAHELRLLADQQVAVRFPYPAWDGSSLEGKTLLIYAEQGLGDEIMFASCIPDVMRMAGHCIIECAPRLAPIFRRSFPGATIVGGDRLQVGWLVDMPPIDLQIAAGSLPKFVRPTIDSFPDRPAYLQPDTQRLAHWRARVAALGPGLKVGICWRSGLQVGERKKYYSDLAQWGAVFKVPGVHFVNLQYGECGDELQAARDGFGVPITNFDGIDLRQDIDDSAALTASLDVVISAGTAVVEMAGALGVEAYLLNGFGKQWIALGRSDFSPWHPKTRYIEQSVSGDWDTQLALAAEQLRARVEGQAAALTSVTLRDGVEVSVNAACDDLARYVLSEQLGWFDAEYEFVLGLVRDQAQVVDVGAGVGAYALALAARPGAGRVYAYAGSAADTNLLMRSRLRNGLQSKLVVAIGEATMSLDEHMDQQGLDAVDLVRISPAMSGTPMLEAGRRFFTVNSPLVMFGIGHGEQFDVSVPHWLEEQGYAIYRLVPGLGALAPANSTDELDVFSLNLFACKPDRAGLLERQGKLVRQLHTLATLPGIDLPYWQQYLGALPYAAALVDGWAGSDNRDPDWQVYWMALNLFAMAKSEHGTAAERYACLQAAETVLNALLHEHPNLPRLVSLCRILIDQGKREMAVGLLNQICELLDAGMSWALDEPMLALSDEDAVTAGAGADQKWVLAMVLAQRENWRAFSTWFTAEESLPALLEVRALGYAGEAAERKIGLIESRFGQPG